MRGEKQFLGEVPTSKKKRRVYFANSRQNWEALMREASAATNLAEVTLRQYARVVRRGVRVKELSFGHHIEVQRCHYINEKGKRRFDGTVAREILTLAKEKGWVVSETRAECSSRFPTLKMVETALEKTKRIMSESLKTIDGADRLEFLDALAAELTLIREQVERERDVVILRILEDGEESDPCLNPDFAY
ncbi:MAG: hypothetical protein ABSF15_24215 [Candidatus Sulfotelmatobacter sp.]